MRYRAEVQGGQWHTIFHMAPDVPEALITGRERQYLSVFSAGLYGVGDNPAAIGTEEIDEYVRVYTKPGALRAYLSYYRSLFDEYPSETFGKSRPHWRRSRAEAAFPISTAASPASQSRASPH